MTTDFDQKLVQLLDDRANNLQVVPDEFGVREAGRPVVEAPSVPSHRRGWWLAVAAALALLLMGAVAMSRTSGSPELASGSPSFAINEDADLELAANELVIWMDPEATWEEVAATEAWLAERTDVTSVRYMNRDTTYTEFVELWADTPEVINAVSPDQLPTSFRVTVDGDPAQLRGAEVFPGVRNVETALATFVGPGETIGLLSFEDLGDPDLMHLTLIEGLEAELLRSNSVRHLRGSAMPGQRGNVVVAGHRTRYGQPFGHLDELMPGDLIVIETSSHQATFYEVIEQADGSGHAIVDPSRTDLLQTTELAMLTLVSEHSEYSDSQRIVVQARLLGEPVGPQPGLIELPDRLPPFD